MKNYSTYICGGYYSNLDDRGDCPNALHDWPLPHGYVDASEVAGSRLSQGWSNWKCPECKLYGWAPGSRRPESTNPIEVKTNAT